MVAILGANGHYYELATFLLTPHSWTLLKPTYMTYIPIGINKTPKNLGILQGAKMNGAQKNFLTKQL